MENEIHPLLVEYTECVINVMHYDDERARPRMEELEVLISKALRDALEHSNGV